MNHTDIFLYGVSKFPIFYRVVFWLSYVFLKHISICENYRYPVKLDVYNTFLKSECIYVFYFLDYLDLNEVRGDIQYDRRYHTN